MLIYCSPNQRPSRLKRLDEPMAEVRTSLNIRMYFIALKKSDVYEGFRRREMRGAGLGGRTPLGRIVRVWSGSLVSVGL
jgi:hypothetical protein